ncbi:MAG TPA: hypothetical protein VGK06_11670 [Methanosarcina sp.]|jgi:hypothetical protein
MPKFESKYTDDDFLKVIEGDSKTTGFIAKAVGAARSTTVLWLEKLQTAEKIEKESIDNGNMFVWKLKKN